MTCLSFPGSPPVPATLHRVQQLFPTPASDVDVASVYLSDLRERADGRPWLVVNMATTLDGATALTGRSGGIGGTADHAAFHALRTAADVILVGAGTARAENYGPVKVPAELAAARRDAGRARPARLALVSRSCSIDPDARLFPADAERPLVYTVEEAPADRVAALEPVAEIVRAGTGSVDPRLILDDLAAREVRCVLCEGGPSFNGNLIAAHLVDEWCLTLGPLLAGGDSARAAHGPDVADAPGYRLDRALGDGRDLLLRYVAAR